MLVGDDNFPESAGKDSDGAWSAQRNRDEERKRDRERDKDTDEEETEQPFEKIKIRVTFPRFNELPNELILEHWAPWKQVYGEKDESGRLKKDTETES